MFYILGNEEANRIIRMILSSTIFVGGFVACFLDNTVPGKHFQVICVCIPYHTISRSNKHKNKKHVCVITV